MEINEILKAIVEDFHTSVMATNNSEGHPVTCAIDMMDWDETGLYFLTGRGKSLYDRLKADGHLAITLMKGTETMNTTAVSFSGTCRELGPSKLPELFAKNPYMNEIFPTEESRQAMTVFHIYEGNGEWFDMGSGNITHEEFMLGGIDPTIEGYLITDECIGCSTCIPICPRNCITIDDNSNKALIDQLHCIKCGNCRDVCPSSAVLKLH